MDSGCDVKRAEPELCEAGTADRYSQAVWGSKGWGESEKFGEKSEAGIRLGKLC